MRVIVWGINYEPEVTGIGPHNTALCEFLLAAGHDVEMLTTFCYYPAWKKLPADRWKLYRTDRINGVPVHRCWHFVPDRKNALARMVHELSFIKTSFLRFLTLRRPDLFVVVSPPLLLGLAAWLAGAIKRVPFVFHVQDLQPDAAVGLGMLKKSRFTQLLYEFESLAYRKAARVSGISADMLEAFRRKGVPQNKLIYFPNSILLPDEKAITDGSRFREQHGFKSDDFLALYSGNLGVKHGLENVLKAARLIKDPRIKIILCGEGSNREALEYAIREYGLKNAMHLPLQPDDGYREMLGAANLCLVTQQKGSGHAFFPSKLLNALAYGKPVLSVADAVSELARVVKDGGFGENVLPDRPEDIALILEELARAPDRLAAAGKAGRRYVAQFERAGVLGRFVEKLQFAGE